MVVQLVARDMKVRYKRSVLGIAWTMLNPLMTIVMFALGVGLLLSALAVSFPDVVDMYQIVLSAWYFLTPLLYPKTILPEAYHWWFNLNPMYHLVEAFRAPIYAGWPAGPHTLMAATASSFVALILGWVVFTARADEIIYRL